MLSVACLGVMAILAVYLWTERYFLRFMPLPVGAVSALYDPADRQALAPTKRPLGDFVPTRHDMTTEAGLRQALNEIQEISPFSGTGRVLEGSITFESWLQYVRSEPFFCTDGTMLFLLAAWAQGLPARQWWLLPKDWEAGGGHSIAEFFNPRTQRWILVDPQHAAVVRDSRGEPLDMAQVLKLWHDGRHKEVRADYGPYADFMLKNGRGPTTEQYFFESRYIEQAVLNLREPTWFAVPNRNGFIIGYAILGDNDQHDYRVFLTKAAAVALLLVAVIAGWLAFPLIRRVSPS